MRMKRKKFPDQDKKKRDCFLFVFEAGVRYQGMPACHPMYAERRLDACATYRAMVFCSSFVPRIRRKKCIFPYTPFQTSGVTMPYYLKKGRYSTFLHCHTLNLFLTAPNKRPYIRFALPAAGKSNNSFFCFYFPNSLTVLNKAAHFVCPTGLGR